MPAAIRSSALRKGTQVAQSPGKLKKLIGATHKRGVKLRKLLKFLEKLNANRRRELREKEHRGGNITMYDTVTVASVPANPEAVAGYVNGKFQTYNDLVRKFPHAKHLSIAVTTAADALCLDIELGNARPGQAPEWVKRQHRRGVRRPVVYANTSTMPSVISALTNAGIHRSEYRVWTAHYTGVPHIEAGSDATQYTDRALNRNLDASLCSPTFFD